jgi:fungal STAND N-terminal Goodbye domain
MSINPSPELKSLFETALKEFEKRAGTNLIQHPIIDKLANCESVDSVINVLQEQAQAFRNFRGDDGKLMTWLKRTVSVLYTLSTSDVLCESISLVCVYSFLWHALCNTFSFSLFHPQGQYLLDSLYFLAYVSYLSSPEDPCDICGLHQVIKDISTSYDALVDLFESFESFLRRLDIYTKIPSNAAITAIIVKILTELLSTISFAIQQVKQGRLSEPHTLRYDA